MVLIDYRNNWADALMDYFKNIYEILALTIIKESLQNKQLGYSSKMSLIFDNLNKKIFIRGRLI